MKLFRIPLLILLVAAINFNCTTKNSNMINIEFTENKPEFYGSTGVHLYEAKLDHSEGEKRVIIDENANAIDLYKLYYDIAIFLSNQVQPIPDDRNIKTYPIFGNPKHSKFLKRETDINAETQIIGFLDIDDVKEVYLFLKMNELDKKEKVQLYYNSLDENVKKKLQMLLDDRIVSELHFYFEFMVKFFKECTENKSEVVIIANA